MMQNYKNIVSHNTPMLIFYYLCFISTRDINRTEKDEYLINKKLKIMIITTTSTIEGHPIIEYKGIVTGETIIGANAFKDFLAGIRDIIGGRSGSYEKVLREGKDTSIQEMIQRAEELGANAIVGIDLDYETVGQGGSMLMVTCSGTAVRI